MLANVLQLSACPIFTQLQIEEAILRTTNDNWCIINRGSPPAIVMGISGKTEELINIDAVAKNPIPIIRRFSGGGTVVIDEETLFITFIFQKSSVDVGNCPKKLLDWTREIYTEAFTPQPFAIQENDYTIGAQKIGGNAQYFAKNCFLHHTSFLWDFCPDRMQLLKMPPKTPVYRAGRSHVGFLDRLNRYFSSQEEVVGRCIDALAKRYTLSHINERDTHALLATPHRKATSLISPF